MIYRNSRDHGRFTLIELLVVVAIISVLASMLLPALSKARDVARTSVCISNLRSIGGGVHLYTNDHDDFIPHGFHKVGPTGEPYKYPIRWSNELRSYLGRNFASHASNPQLQGNLAHCPSYEGTNFDTISIHPEIRRATHWEIRSYGINNQFRYGNGHAYSSNRQTRVVYPESTILVAESGFYEPGEWRLLFYNWRHGGSRIPGPHPKMSGWTKQGFGGRCPNVKVDGHVELTAYDESLINWPPLTDTELNKKTWASYLDD